MIVANIRARWSALIADGESTFRETWQLEPITSKCHAWSATPTFDLSTDILGIAPLEPGFARFRVAPHIAHLEWARGAFPTPRGDIRIEWHRDANRFELALTVPNETEAEIVLPARETMIVGAGMHRIVIE
jgi:hypothetical protein